jgi:hypothetical protein
MERIYICICICGIWQTRCGSNGEPISIRFLCHNLFSAECHSMVILKDGPRASSHLQRDEFLWIPMLCPDSV